MPAKSQDHVHRLIQSMSPAEKRWFKRHLARNKQEAGCIPEQLFDAISAMEAYDEKALMQRFASERFTHHFAITKRRLYESILASLVAFHAEGSASARIHSLLHQVEVLHHRALYADAGKVLRSARKLAAEGHRLPDMLAVREWERRLIECRNYEDMEEEHVMRMEGEDEALRQGIAETDALWAIKSRLFILLYRMGAAREPAVHDAVAAMLHHPLLDPSAALHAPKARYLHHHIRSAAAFAMGSAAECRVQLERCLAVLEADRAAFRDEPSLVLGVVSNLAYVCMQCGDHESAFALLKLFRELPGKWGMPETEDLDLKLFATTVSLELSMHLRSGDAEKAMGLIPVLERGLATHGHRLGSVRRESLRFLAAYAHFVHGSCDKALGWCNDLLNGLRHDDVSDAARYGRMLHLMILVELGKKDLLPYGVRNAERFLKQHGLTRRFESRLLQLMRELARARHAAERMAAFASFRDEAERILDDPAERNVLEHLDPVAWAEGKMNGSAMAECIRQRVGRMRNAAA